MFSACTGAHSTHSEDHHSEALSQNTPSESLQLSFKTMTSDSLDGSALNTVTIPAEYADYCRPETGSETDRCHATPKNYDLGILAIYLVDCRDAADGAVACGDENFDHVADRVELYNGDQIDVSVGDLWEAFPKQMATLTQSGNYGALQIVTAYVQQQFPDEESDPVQAGKVIPALQGVSYRICTSSDAAIDEATMAARCGREDAEMGDYLIDVDGDGVFGFMSIVNDGSETTVNESEIRPAGYDANDPVFANGEVSFLDSPEDEYTSSDFYGISGYFAPILPFDAVKTLAMGVDYQIGVTFEITDSFDWHDGADSGMPDASICVDALSDQDCSPDKDPSTVGVYDPYYDDAFLPNMPQVTVNVDELHERLYVGTGEYSIMDTWDAIVRFDSVEDLDSEVTGSIAPAATLPVKQMVSADGIYQNFEHGIYVSDARDEMYLGMLFTDEDYNGIDTECRAYSPPMSPPECDTENRRGSIAIIAQIKDQVDGGLTLSRHIHGDNTQLAQPHGIWVDEAREYIYAANTHVGGTGNILVFHAAFDSATDGNIAPDRVITSDQMSNPVFVFIDEAADRMFVANMGPTGPSVLIFNGASQLNGAVTPDTRIIDDTPHDRSDTDNTRLTIGNNMTTHNVWYDGVHEQIIVAHHTNEVIFYDVSDWDLDAGMGAIEPDASEVRYLEINESSLDSSLWSAYGIFYLPAKDRLYVSCGYSSHATEEKSAVPDSGSPENEIKVYDGVSNPEFGGMAVPDRVIQWDNGLAYYPPQGLWVTEYTE